MSFGSRVKKPLKVQTLEIPSVHLIQHFQAFLLAGGLIARDHVITDYNLPKTIKLKLQKVKTISDG